MESVPSSVQVAYLRHVSTCLVCYVFQCITKNGPPNDHIVVNIHSTPICTRPGKINKVADDSKKPPDKNSCYVIFTHRAPDHVIHESHDAQNIHCSFLHTKKHILIVFLRPRHPLCGWRALRRMYLRVIAGL